MTIIVASGTSIPTSTTVVETRIRRAPSWKRRIVFSFSSASTFLLCPEKYRRNLLSGSEDSEDTIFGNMVHVGLAEAYKQVQNWGL